MLDFKSAFTYTNGVDFPETEAKNSTAGNAKDGTHFNKLFAGDIWGFFQAVLHQAGLTPSGNVDKFDNSQILEGLKTVILSDDSVTVTNLDPELTERVVGYEETGIATIITLVNGTKVSTVTGHKVSGKMVGYEIGGTMVKFEGHLTVSGKLEINQTGGPGNSSLQILFEKVGETPPVWIFGYSDDCISPISARLSHTYPAFSTGDGPWVRSFAGSNLLEMFDNDGEVLRFMGAESAVVQGVQPFKVPVCFYVATDIIFPPAP